MYRTDKWQNHFGVPLPASTQWKLIDAASPTPQVIVDVVDNFPEECRKIMESLAEIYRVDALAKEQRLSEAQRPTLHQQQSQSIMDELHLWMKDQIQQKQVEPNSGLGQAIAYMLKRWEPQTSFLSVPGAPLDNNICERALKMAILHRKFLGVQDPPGS